MRPNFQSGPLAAEMRFRLLDNDAVADAVEQGELDAGLVIDLGCAAPVLARTTLRADPACLLVPRGHPFWDRESIPLADLETKLAGAVKNKATPLILVCASGMRSKRAVATATKLGFERAQSLAGGMRAWREAGLPVEKA